MSKSTALHRPGRWRVALAGLGAAVAVLAPAALLAGVARAATGPYVSLGDSYTAAPLVPFPTGSPLLCGRSTNNYPSDVARAIDPSSFTDASCSSATTADMTGSQSLEGGIQTAPPQFDALRSNDALVTLGIGGNDAGLISVVEKCAELDALDPFGSRCKNHYESGAGDPNVAAVNAAGPKVAAVIQGIHSRAPHARVLVVGYPDGLPLHGGCWPLVPISSGDIAYINSLEQQLNSVLASVAASNNATYVNTFTSSIGHDACKAPGTAWVNGFLPTSAAFPLHPNAAGERNMANQVLGKL
ncbi:MAG: SGNH/GDSL hydrolase family protein [Solirubrobacteraceae bacterium]